MTTFQVIGQPVPRVYGAEKVTGEAQYAADIALPGLLWGKCLFSPVAHARIVSIDTSAAKALPGVHAVLTGADIRTTGLWGRAVKDYPPLAYEVVRYSGERVVAVAADDEDIAQQALDLIEVEYEELPAVFDPMEAQQTGAPILHPDFNNYFGFRQKQDTPSNLYMTTHWEKGDVEAGFAQADTVIENTYVTQRQHQGYLEPQVLTVHVDETDGRVHVYHCTKVPHNTRESLATAAAIPEASILFHHAHIGGDFGGKGNSRNTAVAYFLAKATGRPVRMISDYLEEFLAGNPRHHTITTLKTGVMRDGTLVAHSVMYTVDSGAYAAFKPTGTIGGANQAAGPYVIPNCRIDSAFVYTNTVPGGFMRGPGEPQGVFAIESHIDEVARAIGMDPVELRIKNLIREGDETAFGEVLQDVKAVETLQAAVEASGYNEPKPAYVGRGVALADRPPGPGEGTAQVTLKPDGSITLGTPIFDQGSGIYTVLKQVVAEELRIHPDQIAIEVWNSDEVPFDSGIAGSRATRVNTTVAYAAMQELKKSLISTVARTRDWPEDSLTFVNGEVRRPEIEEAVSWQDAVVESGEIVIGRANVKDNERSHVTGFCVQVAEVSVDPETGEIKLLGLTSAHDVGQIINPVAHQGQINGCIQQGLGYALMEELKLDDGRVSTLSFGDYKMPTVVDMPPLKTVLVQSEHGVGPYQIKGIGEAPTAPVAPAIANAIADAVGVRLRNLPVTAEKVYRALKDQQ